MLLRRRYFLEGLEVVRVLLRYIAIDLIFKVGPRKNSKKGMVRTKYPKILGKFLWSIYN